MTTAQFQAHFIERHYWFKIIAEYDAMYWAYYSDWSRPRYSIKRLLFCER